MLDRMYRGMIIRKTPEQIEEMAAAGEILVRCLQMLARQGPPGRHHRGARRGRREVHPLAGRRALLQGLPRLPGLDLRLAELDGRPRHPRARTSCGAATSSRSTSASTYEGWVADAAITVADRPDRRPSAEQLLDDDPGRRSSPASSRCSPATTSATSRTRSSARSSATASRSSAPSSATGSAARCTRTRRSPTSASPARARSSRRAWCCAIEPMVNAGGARRPDGRRRLGRLLRRTARSPPTSSSRSRSPPTARGSSRPGTSRTDRAAA